MNTKSIPAMIMLLGGAMACVLGIRNHYQTTDFLTMLLIVLILFYVLGLVIKSILDKHIVVDEKLDDVAEEWNDETKENIESNTSDDE